MKRGKIIKKVPRFSSNGEREIFSYLLEREELLLSDLKNGESEINRFLLSEIQRQLIYFATNFGKE